MAAYDDEIFGPVLSISRVASYEEALALVNGNPYGNGVALFTRDGGVARRFQFEVQAGMVGINVPIPVPVASYSFGGWKQSSSATATSTGPTGSTSIRAARSSPPAGPTQPARASTSASPRTARPGARAVIDAAEVARRLSAAPLEGRHVRLEPLREDFVDELAAAAEEDRTSYAWTSVPAGRAAMAAHVAELVATLAAGEQLPFVQIRRADGRAVGLTRYLTLRRRPGEEQPFAVEIGGTWLAASAQRTALNTEAKLLLLEYAFARWGVRRVDFKTDARNRRSRDAIAALGAQFEGILRGWQPSQVAGEERLERDSALYAILAPEWPERRKRLAARLEAGRRG